MGLDGLSRVRYAERRDAGNDARWPYREVRQSTAVVPLDEFSLPVPRRKHLFDLTGSDARGTPSPRNDVCALSVRMRFFPELGVESRCSATEDRCCCHYSVGCHVGFSYAVR